MTRAVLVTGALLLALAAPAQATLLVRSDGAGLLVEDKNGRNDSVHIDGATRQGRAAYLIENAGFFEVFKFDRQAGCHSTSNDREVVCERIQPNVLIRLIEGDDSLTMFGVPVADTALVLGGPGEDRLNGHHGVDRIEAGTGEDEITGNDGNDTIFGQEHSDRIFGNRGNDQLRGEGAADTVAAGPGADVVRGGSGNDMIFTNEGEGIPAEVDTVDCGTGTDTVFADLRDVLQSDCNNVDQSPVGETPHVNVLGNSLRVSRAGGVRVRLSCPRGVGSLGCKGTLRLKLDSRTATKSRSRRVSYSIKAGRRKTVALDLTRADVRKLRGKRRHGVLTSVERGRIGPKTTIRNPRLRLR